MKKVFIYCLAVIISSFSIIANAEMEILNIIQKDNLYFVTVDYTNNTGETYETFTVKCDVLDKSENVINSSKREFSGPIKPGFKVTFKIPIESLGKKVDSAYCSSKYE